MNILCRLGIHRWDCGTFVDEYGDGWAVLTYNWCERRGCQYDVPLAVNVEYVRSLSHDRLEMSDFAQPEGAGPILNFERDWCGRHLEPYRADWPRHSAVAMVLLFDAFLADPRVQLMAGFDPGTPGSTADAARIPALVAECGPLCCFLGDEVMEEIRAEAFIGSGPRIDAIQTRQEEAP